MAILGATFFPFMLSFVSFYMTLGVQLFFPILASLFFRQVGIYFSFDQEGGRPTFIALYVLCVLGRKGFLSLPIFSFNQVFYVRVFFSCNVQPFKQVHKQWRTETLIIHKTCEVYSLWFFEELLKLVGISHGVHLDLSNEVSTTICGICLIPRFLFVINNGSRSPIQICPQNDLGFPFIVRSHYS